MASRPVPLLCIAAALVVGIAGQTAPSNNVINTYNAAGLATEGKVETCDTSVDYFPWKIPQSTMIKAQFEVTYHKTYKIVKTTGATKKTYLLVQRGCPTPVGVTSDVQVTVPLKNVVLASGSWIGFLEHMGESMAIKGVNGVYTTSPCVNKRAMASTTEAKIVDMSAYGFNASTSVYQTPSWGTGPKTPDAALTAGIDAHFVDGWSSGKNGIFFGPEGEPTYLAANEWIHYMSAFFNKEQETSLFSSQSKNRWTCWSGAATGASVVPKIAWIDYYGVSYGVTTPIGFVVNQCSKKDDASYRFCDMIKAAGGTPVADYTPTKETSPSLYDKENGQLLGVSDEDIKKYVAGADVIVFQNQVCYTHPSCPQRIVRVGCARSAAVALPQIQIGDWRYLDGGLTRVLFSISWCSCETEFMTFTKLFEWLVVWLVG